MASEHIELERKLKEELEKRLKELYKKNDPATFKELAEVECSIWNLYLMERERTGATKHQNLRSSDRSKWFVTEYKAPARQATDIRAHLLSAGSISDMVWESVANDGLGLVLGYTLFNKVRKEKSKESEQKEAFKHLIEDLKAHGSFRTVNGRKTLRSHPNRGKTKESVEKRNQLLESKEFKNFKEFKVFIRQAAEPLVNRLLIDLNKSEISSLMTTFDSDLMIAIDNLSRKISKLRYRDNDSPISISKTQLADACKILGIKHKHGTEIDMKAANGRYRKLAANLHEDRPGGKDPKVKQQYLIVNQAWNIVQMYDQQCKER